MAHRRFPMTKWLALIPVFVVLVIAAACGDDATSTPQPTATTAPAATSIPQPTATTAPAATSIPQPTSTTAPATTATPRPTATPAPTPTSAPPAAVGPFGTINVGLTEVHQFQLHPALGAVSGVAIGTSMGETLLRVDKVGEYHPNVAKEWGIAPDGVTWTFKINKGVPFHKGYGEVKAEDVIWSMLRVSEEGSINNFASIVGRLWNNPEGSVKALDDYTIEVNTGVPQFDMLFRVAKINFGFMISQKEFEDVGKVKEKLTVSTGPWEMVDHSTGQFWKMKAVDPHWRKTPFFVELIYHDIAEESTRVANFKVGRLDTFFMNLDSRPNLAKEPGVKFMRVENGADEGLNIFGNWYDKLGTAEHAEDYPGWDPDLPWVSSDPDPASDAWKNAVKVRQAMYISVNRQEIVDTLLQGEGKATILWGWVLNEHRFAPDMKWEFNPEKAKQLLAEAGYPGGGFDVTVTPVLRAVSAEVEACEAVGSYWGDIGINAKLQKIPLSGILPSLRAHTYNQTACWGTSGFTDPLFLLEANIIFKGLNPVGLHHPFLAERVPLAARTVDTEERFKIMLEIARFMFDNALNSGLYSVHINWPLSPKIDSWLERLHYSEIKWPSAFEWVPHRK